MLIKKKPSRVRYNERRVGDRIVSGRIAKTRKVVREGVTKFSKSQTDNVSETKVANESAQALLIPRGIRKRYIG